MAKSENFCRLCGEKTKTVFNIDFKAVPVCEDCASSIFIQQSSWYVDFVKKHNNKKKNEKNK